LYQWGAGPYLNVFWAVGPYLNTFIVSMGRRSLS